MTLYSTKTSILGALKAGLKIIRTTSGYSDAVTVHTHFGMEGANIRSYRALIKDGSINEVSEGDKENVKTFKAVLNN